MVRKSILLALVFLCLCAGVGGFCRFASAGEGSGDGIAAFSPSEGLRLPYPIGETGLVLEAVTPYAGRYLEDGGMEQVSQVTALILRNSTENTMGAGTVCLNQGERELHFSFSLLPAGGRMLVLEEDRRLYLSKPLTACRANTTIAAEKVPGVVTVREDGKGTIILTNPGDTLLSQVKLYFKSYDPGQKLYLGGITYEITLCNLLPGQSRSCESWYYDPQGSQILHIEATQ